MAIGAPPRYITTSNFDLAEVMYYLYLPVVMGDSDLRLPPNVKCCEDIIHAATNAALYHCNLEGRKPYQYIYLSARKGWASPDNPLNRPGWHCDGYGTDDLNYVWWVGPGTRFAMHPFHDISPDHRRALEQFEEQVQLDHVTDDLPQRHLWELTPEVVHATPIVQAPGCMRQFVKISFSDHQYNLENNSHNYLFHYAWPLESRDVARNDTHTAQQDYYVPTT